MRKLFPGLMAVVFCLTAVVAQAAVTTFNTNMAAMPSEDEKVLPDASLPWVPGYIVEVQQVAALRAAMAKVPMVSGDGVRLPVPLAIIRPGKPADIPLWLPACQHSGYVHECAVVLHDVRLGPHVDLLRVFAVFNGEAPRHLASITPFGVAPGEPGSYAVALQYEQPKPGQTAVLRLEIASLYSTLDGMDVSSLESVEVSAPAFP